MADHDLTTFTLVSKDGHDGEWPETWSEVETRIEGDLADRVRAKTEAPDSAVVTLWERGEDGGYSEVTTEWDVTFEVRVDGRKVFADDFGYRPALNAETGQQLELEPWERRSGNGLTRMLAWLEDAGRG